MPPAIIPPDVHRISDHCWVVRWEDTFLQLWGAHTAIDDVRAVRPLAERFVTERAGPKVALVYIEADSMAPDSRTRVELGRLGGVLRQACSAIAYVYAGSGFRAAAVRSVMGAILLVDSLGSRGGAVPRSFAGVMPALAWTGSRLPDGHSVRVDHRLAAVEQVVREFRARHEHHESATPLRPTVELPRPV